MFKVGGRKVFAKRVNHPGTKANPFVERTVDGVESPINKIFSEAMDNIINKLTN
jgi:hypothetical protein